MDIRKAIRKIIITEGLKPTVIYSAVVFDDPIEIAKIQKLVNEYVPENKGWRKPYDFHMTISLGKFPESLYLRGDLNNAIAVGTNGYYSKNDMPHITLAFSKWGSPSESKEIKNWEPIDKISVTGTIREVGEGNIVIK